MYNSIKLEAQPKAQAGFVYLCQFCGEGVSKGNKLCKSCKTKKGREEILEANLQILKELREKGYCKNEVMFPTT